MLVSVLWKGILIRCWCDCKLVWALQKPMCSILKTLQVDHPRDPAMPLCGIGSKDVTTSYSTRSCIVLFIATLLMIAMKWQQFLCPPTDDWIWYLITMEFQSSVRKSEIMTLACKWMETENIITDKANQTQQNNASCALLFVDPCSWCKSITCSNWKTKMGVNGKVL